MLTRNLVGGLAAIAIGAIYLSFAMELRISSLDDTLGSRGMPVVYGWLMIVLGALVAVQALVAAWRQPAAERAALMATEWRGQGRKLLWAAGMLGFVVAYLLSVRTLGYGVAMAALIASVAMFLGARPGWRPLLVGVVGALVLWSIFVPLLGVPMPRGLLAHLGG